MPEEPLRVGVVGCGFFGENHLAAWANIENVTLAAVCDLDPRKACCAAERHGAEGISIYPEAAAMLDAERLDFLDIATTMRSHAALVGACARSPASGHRPKTASTKLG